MFHRERQIKLKSKSNVNQLQKRNIFHQRVIFIMKLIFSMEMNKRKKISTHNCERFFVFQTVKLIFGGLSMSIL